MINMIKREIPRALQWGAGGAVGSVSGRQHGCPSGKLGSGDPPLLGHTNIIRTESHLLLWVSCKQFHDFTR